MAHEINSTFPGLSLRKAALIAGYGLLIMVICGPFSQLYVLPKYLVYDDIAATMANIRQEPVLFVMGMLAAFLVLTMDIVVAWALYILFYPVNPSLSLLTSWLRVVYAAIAFGALACLFVAYRLATSPPGAAMPGDQVQAQFYLLLTSFNYVWGAALILFGVYLLFLSVLIAGSRHVPRILSIPVAVAGLGWIVDSLAPYIAPEAQLDWVFYTFFGELVFMVWLLIGGWFLNTDETKSHH